MMAGPESTIDFEVVEDVALITLDNPPVNILTGAMMDEITAALERVQADDTLKAVAFTARGKAFSAGADIGEHPPVGVAELPALVGRAKAIEITATGRTYSADEMHACGFVTQVVPTDQLDDALASVLKDLRRASPLVMRLNVRTLKRSRSLPFAEALATAEKVFLDELMTSEDPVEGIDSFYEKRRPVWRNR
jgi:enoyl-CoA hydratase/carnithine racemase